MLKQLLILVFLLSTIHADAPEEEEGVLVLTDDNFDEIVNNAELILVEFYAPWCGHCKSLAPEYAAAAQQLKSQDVLLAKVDATVHKSVANRFGVKSYPTLKIFRNGAASDYNGPRQKDGIVSYMEKQMGPSAKPIESAEALKQFLDHPDVTIVGFFSEKSGDIYSNFKKAADALRDDEFKFAEVSHAATLKEYGYSKDIVIFTHEKDAEKKVFPGISTGAYSTADITSWIYAKSVPLVGEITKQNENRYKKRNVPIVKLYFDVDFNVNIKRTNYYINRLKKVAEEFQSKLSFAVAKRSQYKNDMARFGVENKEIALVIDDFVGGPKFACNEEISLESMKKFVNDYLANKLEPFLKSAPVPETNDEPVTVVVGKTFNDIVMDTTKDVMIELYAPWCGHCKKLEPIYKELAETLKKDGVTSVVIAKMDATVNDSPNAKIQANGYPNIFFVPANNKNNPKLFTGDRDVKSLYDFIKKHASTLKKDEL